MPHPGHMHDAYADDEQAEHLLAGDDALDTSPSPLPDASENGRLPGRVSFIRVLALLCACSLSVGSHYATQMLGPLKSRLSREMGTDNADFGLLVSAFSLNSTWTPLLGGLLASKLGTTFTSILATGVIFLGQALLLLGNLVGSVRLMVFGMFVFGLGVSPLAVAQEAIIVRFFKSHGLGMSMAFGLVAGKFASFVAARTSFPLSERYGPSAPFVVATCLAGFSVVINTVYIFASRWIVAGTGTELEAHELRDEARKVSAHSLTEAQALEEVANKRRVDLRDITTLGDVFWAYIGINVFCGIIWHPFNHLAANIFEHRYDLSESDASIDASYLLAGSVFLYPICGYVVDRVKARGIVLKMFALSSCLTLLCYAWLALPPTMTRTPLPAIACFGIALGFSPLLLVVLVPQIVPSKYVSTTLGAHKSLENVGQTISQTLAGLALDVSHGPAGAPGVGPGNKWDATSVQNVLNTFALINVVQLFGILALARLQKRRARAQDRRAHRLLGPGGVAEDPHDEDAVGLRRSVSRFSGYFDESIAHAGPAPDVHADAPEPVWPDAHVEGDAEAPAPPAKEARPPSLSFVREQRRLLPSHHTTYTPPGSPRSTSPPRRAHGHRHLRGSVSWRAQAGTDDPGRETREARRGRVFAGLSLGLIVLAWVLFLSTAWVKLRGKS